MNQRIVIIQAKGENKGQTLFNGTTDEFEKVAREDPFFSQFFAEDERPNYKFLAALAEREGWDVEYMERVFNFQLSEMDAMLVRGALADRVKEVRSELEILRVTKERDLTEWERSLLPHTLRFKDERDDKHRLITTTREELQEQIDPWITYVDHFESLLQQCCEGIESLR